MEATAAVAGAGAGSCSGGGCAEFLSGITANARATTFAESNMADCSLGCQLFLLHQQKQQKEKEKEQQQYRLRFFLWPELPFE
ncbi:hypothetical protein ACLKA6_003509 [Drosophila palustris]